MNENFRYRVFFFDETHEMLVCGHIFPGYNFPVQHKKMLGNYDRIIREIKTDKRLTEMQATASELNWYQVMTDSKRINAFTRVNETISFSKNQSSNGLTG